MGNKRNSGTAEARGIRGVVEALEARLPSGWSLTLQKERLHARNRSFDARLVVRDPSGLTGTMSMQVKTRIEPRDVAGLRQTDQPWMVIAPFLSPRTRELMAEAKVSFADETGNIRFVLERPAVWIETRGLDRAPNREVRPLHSLRGPSSGRVIRALLDFRPPYGVRQLAQASNTPLGSVSRVITLLEHEALVVRDIRKQIMDLDWEKILRRWARDYDIQTANRVLACLEPRGLPALTNKLLGFRDRYALTGTMSRLAMIYVDDADQAAAGLGLTPVDAGANVWLLEPFDDVVFDRTRDTADVVDPSNSSSHTHAAVTQVAVDLLTSPGRGPEQAETLIERMHENDGLRRNL